MSRATICDRCDTVAGSDEEITLLQAKKTERPEQPSHTRPSEYRDLCEDCADKLDKFMDGRGLSPKLVLDTTVGETVTDRWAGTGANVAELSFGWGVKKNKVESFMEQGDTRNY